MNKQEIKNEVVRIMNEAGIDIDDSGMAEKNVHGQYQLFDGDECFCQIGKCVQNIAA